MGVGVIILMFGYHEKDIGSTMSNQLVGQAESEMHCGGVGGEQNASNIKNKMALQQKYCVAYTHNKQNGFQGQFLSTVNIKK